MADTTQNSTPYRRILRPDIWGIAAICIAVLVVLPIAAIFWLALFPSENIWPHLIRTTLPRYFGNSLLLMTCVGLLSAAMGTGAAWLVVMHRFPGRRIFEWALLLPLAIPAYIGAYALVDFWEYAGPFQTALRSMFGWQTAQDYWFPGVRTRATAVFVLSMSLYPYIYLLTRAAFREQSACALEVSRALGCGRWGSFWRVGLPLARPAIVAGSAIVMMETLNDFGTVEFFAVQTLTTGIFTVWLQGSNVGGAAQIACVILLLVIFLVVVEKFSRRNMRFHQLTKQKRAPHAEEFSALTQAVAVIACLIPITFGFLMPVAIIGSHALDRVELWASPKLWSAALTTIWVASIAALITISAGVVLVYGARLSRSRLPRLLIPVTTVGYAAPGAVLALGIVVPVAGFENRLADAWLALTGIDPGLFFTGTSAAVIFAYSVRFFAISFGAVDAAFGRVTPSMGMASRSLGKGAFATLRLVHLPMVRGSLLIGALLIFVDSVKELPATLLLRPFGFNTLATHVYDFASLEDIERAAPGALVVILVSIVAVAIVARSSR
jgi:iron(III) transport system permease protein